MMRRLATADSCIGAKADVVRIIKCLHELPPFAVNTIAFDLALVRRNCKDLRSAKEKRKAFPIMPASTSLFNPSSALSYAEFCPWQKPALNRGIGIQNGFCATRPAVSNAS
jgi:hypothetical protein